MILTNSQTKVISSDLTENSDVPSILTQNKPHPNMSNRYVLVRTIDVLQAFEDVGFKWNLMREQKCRGHRKGFGAHLVSLYHPDINFRDSGLENEMIPYLYLRNSYHGGTRLEINLGINRKYCSNGLMVGITLESLGVKHIGIDPRLYVQTTIPKVRNAVEDILVPLVNSLATVEMSKESQMEFAKLALKERFNGNGNFLGGEHEKLLTVNRDEDRGDSMWKVLNRVQENLGLNFRKSDVEIAYRISAKDKDEKPVIKERKVAKVGKIDEVIRLNKFLFQEIVKYQPSNPVQLLEAA